MDLEVKCVPVLTGNVQVFWGKSWGEETAWGALGVLSRDRERPPHEGSSTKSSTGAFMGLALAPVSGEYLGANPPVWSASQTFIGLGSPTSPFLPGPPSTALQLLLLGRCPMGTHGAQRTPPGRALPVFILTLPRV